MGYIAESAYSFNRKNKRIKNESDEDRSYRLANKHNSIFHQIDKVKDARSYVEVKNTIDAFMSEVGKDSIEIYRLNKKLTERIQNVYDDIQTNIDKVNTEITRLENDKFVESSETLQELTTQAEHRLLHFMMQLGLNNDKNTGNRRKIGNFVTQANRVDAMALMKLASLPQYAECFTTKQKQLILEKSKNPAEIVFEKNKQPLLAEKGAELGKLYMKAFNIRNAQKKITNSENNYYFGKEQQRD